jgi:hypothetical protein
MDRFPSEGSLIGVRGNSAEKSQIVWEFSNLKVTKPEQGISQVTQESQAGQGNQILFEDSFATLSSGWGAPSLNLGVRNGKLIVQPDVNAGFVAINQANQFNDIDATIKVNMARSDDPAWGGGLVFWIKDSNNYYVLLVSGNGQFTVRRYVNNQSLATVDWRDSAAVKKGVGQVNELRVVTKGNQAMTYINGTQVATFSGQLPDGGSSIGVKGSSAEKSQITWEFSDLKVTKP